MRKIKILGTGVYLPQQCVETKALEGLTGFSESQMIAKTGVEKRHFANAQETASWMGAEAARRALNTAEISLNEIDLVLCTSGTMEMPIPSTASLIHRQLGLSQIPAYDINSTCLSFVTGLDTISYLVDAGKYRNVLLVSTEIASVGLNMNDLESASLFGDGAAAVVIAPSEESGILGSSMETYSDGWDCCKIPGGGTGLHAENWKPENKQEYQFQMNGKKVFKLASQMLPRFVENLLQQCKCTLDELALVIPHQASLSAMSIIQRKLEVKPERFVNIIKECGNVIAASIPMALHHSIETGKLKRGDKAMLLGTSAGLSIGGLVFVY